MQSLGLALPSLTSHVVLDVRFRPCVVALKWNRTLPNLRVEKLNLDVKKDDDYDDGIDWYSETVTPAPTHF